MTEPVAVKFVNGENLFWKSVRSRVDNYFSSNHISKNASTKTYIKIVLMLALFAGCYATIVFVKPNTLTTLLITMVMGFAMAGIGFSASHAAAHNALSGNKNINRILSMSFNVLGMSDYLWKIKHNVLHHTYTNVFEADEALREGNLMRMTFDAPWKPWHRYQHIYGVFIYAFYTLFWVFILDFEKLMRHNAHGSFKKKPHPRREILIFWITKIYYVIFAFIIPYYVGGYSFGVITVGFLIMHVIASLWITHVLQVEHIATEVIAVSMIEHGKIHKPWAENQLEGTCNFKSNNALLEWYVSGTNYQIEHHLFPLISPEHFPAISKIVRNTAKEFGLQYQLQPSFRKAIVSHYKMLRLLGNNEKSVPVPA